MHGDTGGNRVKCTRKGLGQGVPYAWGPHWAAHDWKQEMTFHSANIRCHEGARTGEEA